MDERAPRMHCTVPLKANVARNPGVHASDYAMTLEYFRAQAYTAPAQTRTSMGAVFLIINTLAC